MRPLRSLFSFMALAALGGFPSLTQAQTRADATGTITAPVATYFQMSPGISNPTAISKTTQRRFPLDARQLRFDGEIASRHMPLFVRPEQANEPARLRIRYISSVAVMPEGSRMRISVNDTLLAETLIEAATEYKTLELEVPAGLLEAGYNAISVSTHHRHRVDCSIEATDELWTQIDPVASGVFFTSAKDHFSKLDDLAGLPLDKDGAAPISVYVPQGSDLASIDRAIRAAQMIAVKADFQKPKITFSREIEPAPGIQLMVGTIAELRARGIETNLLSDASLSVSGRAGDIIRIAVSGATTRNIDENIQRLSAEPASQSETGTASGLRAIRAQKGFILGSESSISLKEMGIPTQDFNGRLFKTSFNIITPADFYPADNGKATMYLDASYPAGLLTSNEAIVRINGKVVGASRLTRSAGDSFTSRPIMITLKALQPGFNQISLEIRTATESDKDCNPLSLIDTPQRLRVVDQTRFGLPGIARASHLPNIGAIASAGYPYVDQPVPVTLYMPKPDFAALGSVATFLARASITSGKPILTRISLTPPDATTGNAIIAGAASEIPANLVEHFGIRKDRLPISWTKAGSVKGNGAEPVKSAPIRTAPDKISRGPIQSDAYLVTSTISNETILVTRKPSAETSILAAPEISETGVASKFLNGLSGILQRTVGYSSEQLSFLHGGKERFEVGRTSKLLVAQQQAMAGGKASWLLLMAADTAALQKEMSALVSSQSWSQLSGRASVYDPAASGMNVWNDGSSYHYALTDHSFNNLTMFAAGWLSNNVQYYIIVMILFCVIFGFFTRKLLNRVGVQQ